MPAGREGTPLAGYKKVVSGDRTLPDSRIVTLPGRAHAAIMTAPQLTADQVIRFQTELELN